MKGTSENRIRSIINFLILGEYLTQTDDEYTVLKLGRNARSVLVGKETIIMKLAKQSVQKESKQSSKQSGKRKSKRGSGSYNMDDIDGELFEVLRELRMEIAHEKDVPAFVVFSNATLADMCEKQPVSMDEMLEVVGVGSYKSEEYAEQFISAIHEYLHK
jgi:ATP-dependent DNA helicase RecQ